MPKNNWLLGVAVLAAAFTLAGCANQNDMEQLNKNEFTLRGMIASDRQQIDALKAQVAQQNNQIEELQHISTPTAGPASGGVNDRVASLEAEVKALQAGMAATPGAVPPPGAPADSVGPGAAVAATEPSRPVRLRRPRRPRKSRRPGPPNSIRKSLTPRPRTSRASRFIAKASTR